VKNYTGQILAIVLVILVVTSVIGFALYARIIRDSQRVVDERASIEANELTETITGLLASSDYDNLTRDDVLRDLFGDNLDCLYTADGCRVSNMTLERLKDFLRSLGFDENVLSDFDFDDEYCMVEIAMRYNNENDRLEIKQDYAYSVLLNKVDWGRCTSIDFFMERIDAQAFTISTFYKQNSKYKDYARNDIDGYLYSSGGVGDWKNYTPNQPQSQLSFPGNYDINKDGFPVHEARFKPLGGDSHLRWRLVGECDVSGYLFVEVGAVCGGKYIGKEFILYGDVFAPPLFDYVLFNGFGNLEMDWDFD